MADEDEAAQSSKKFAELFFRYSGFPNERPQSAPGKFTMSDAEKAAVLVVVY
jgi:hypothetical protein